MARSNLVLQPHTKQYILLYWNDVCHMIKCTNPYSLFYMVPQDAATCYWMLLKPAACLSLSTEKWWSYAQVLSYFTCHYKDINPVVVFDMLVVEYLGGCTNLFFAHPHCSERMSISACITWIQEIRPQVERKNKVMKVMKVMLRKATKVHVYV